MRISDWSSDVCSSDLLTNNNLLLRDHLPAICPPLFPLFDDRVFCSAQFRLATPDPAIFLQCLRQLGATPAQALFIDDKAENAEGARLAGLRAHHSPGMPGLQACLPGPGLPGGTGDATGRDRRCRLVKIAVAAFT